jgi:hypothetical protein
MSFSTGGRLSTLVSRQSHSRPITICGRAWKADVVWIFDTSGMPKQMVLAVIAVMASAQYFRHHADDGTQGSICARSWQAALDLYGLSGVPSLRRLWRLIWIVAG